MKEQNLIKISVVVFCVSILVLLYLNITQERSNIMISDNQMHLQGEVLDISNSFNKSTIVVNTNLTFQIDEKLNNFYKEKNVEIIGNFNCNNKKFNVDLVNFYSSH